MTTRYDSDDRLDEVLAEIERARREPAWTPEPERTPRRLIRPPAPLDEARWAPSRTAVVVVALCALLAALVFGVRVMLTPDTSSAATGSSAKPLQVAGRATVSSTPSGAAAAPTNAASTAATPAAAASPSALNIHVVGAVRTPGVVTVTPGARVEDAVRAAGGLKGADASGINLARPLADGEQVIVPRPGESPPVPSPPAAPAGGQPSAGAAAITPGTPGASAGASALVNLNTADAAALDTLPGVGPVLAQRILDWRTEHGRFSSVEELGEVSGIGDKALERLRSKVTV